MRPSALPVSLPVLEFEGSTGCSRAKAYSQAFGEVGEAARDEQGLDASERSRPSMRSAPATIAAALRRRARAPFIEPFEQREAPAQAFVVLDLAGMALAVIAAT